MPTTSKQPLIYPDMVKLMSDGVWYVDYNGTQDAQYIRDLFGTCLLPTPYMWEMDKDEVMQELSRNVERIN
jgi:hypothetical protein